MKRRGVIVLAGGHGFRMGGTNKAFMPLGNKPLIAHVVDRALNVSDSVAVVVGKDCDESRYTSLLSSSIRIEKDAVMGKGPVAGILRGMKSLEVDYALVLPCDVPFINPNVLRHLFEKAVGADLAIPIWPNGYMEPLQAVYNSAPTIEAAEGALERDELSILHVMNRLRKVVQVHIEDIRRIDPGLLTFFNINTPRDLWKAHQYLKTR